MGRQHLFQIALQHYTSFGQRYTDWSIEAHPVTASMHGCVAADTRRNDLSHMNDLDCCDHGVQHKAAQRGKACPACTQLS